MDHNFFHRVPSALLNSTLLLITMRNKRNKTIIIHSKVAYGYVGGNMTSLVLQLSGQDVISVPTIILSNRYGLPTVGGGIVPSTIFQDVLDGILKLKILDEVSSVITGYIGSTELIKAAAEFIGEIKSTHPEITYLCDPVMGDVSSGLYVSSDVPSAIVEHLLPLADFLTPNQFEMQTIVEKKITSYIDAIECIHKEDKFKNKGLIITGCRFESTKTNFLNLLLAENANYMLLDVEYVPIDPPGTGELFAAHVHRLMLKKRFPLPDAARESSLIVKRVLQRLRLDSRKEFELTDVLFSMKATAPNESSPNRSSTIQCYKNKLDIY